MSQPFSWLIGNRFKKIKSGPDVTSLHPSQGFIEMIGGRSLGSPTGTAYLSEDDYDGNIKFHNILALNGSQDALVRFSFGQCSASCWFGLIGKEKKRIFFKNGAYKRVVRASQPNLLIRRHIVSGHHWIGTSFFTSKATSASAIHVSWLECFQRGSFPSFVYKLPRRDYF